METSQHIKAAAIPFDSAETLPLDGLMQRIGGARVVLIGEASHGTSEFYRAREHITRALIQDKQFDFVAIEGDWPDAAHIDHYVRHAEYSPSEWTAFSRFPTWMWRNEEVRMFVDWLRVHNGNKQDADQVGFHGLDLYSMYTSIQEVLAYLETVDPAIAEDVRKRYQCLAPYRHEPVDYARASMAQGFRNCEADVLLVLKELHARQAAYLEDNPDQFLNLIQNARLVASAEEYYRTMLSGRHNAWNLRDSHMFETLEALLEHYGENSRGVVWAHNSHVGDSDATEMGERGEFNIGRLSRERFGGDMYSIGFGTHTGTVAAASDWGGAMEIKQVQPGHEESYEEVCHRTGIPCFTLPLRNGDPELREAVSQARLQRAIGVIYRPETERQSHYFYTRLPDQFDEYIWLDRTQAVTPIDTRTLEGMPDTYPFGL